MVREVFDHANRLTANACLGKVPGDHCRAAVTSSRRAAAVANRSETDA
jgi:hypothetical protein